MKRKSIHGRAGFTLIEVMVVLVIIGMMAALIGVNVLEKKRQADRDAALIDVRMLSSAVESYRLRHSRLPESLDKIVPSEVARLRPDPWGSAYVFTQSGDTFQVSSCGPDRTPGGTDDISIEAAEKS